MNAPTKEQRISNFQLKLEMFKRAIVEVGKDESTAEYVNATMEGVFKAFENDKLSEDYLLGGFEICGTVIERMRQLLTENPTQVTPTLLVNYAFAEYANYVAALSITANYPPETREITWK